MFAIPRLLFAIFLGRTGLVASAPAQATIGPSLDLVSILPKVGTISTDQDISVLDVRDQNGADDDWGSYVEATPSSSAKRYVVEFNFELSTGTDGNSYSGFRLATNTKGPTMSWSPRFFEILNLVTNKWVAIGNNTGCESWVWCYKELTMNENASNFINTNTKRVLIRLQSSTQNPDSVLVDYLNLNLLSTTPRPSTTTPTKSPTRRPTLSPVRVVTPSPAKSPTMAPIPKTAIPTKSPTRVPTPTPVRLVTRSPTKPPTMAPTRAPTMAPTRTPTRAPTRTPTRASTVPPTRKPTIQPTPSVAKPWWQPKASDMLTWQWQLQGTIDTSLNVSMYDIDLFDTSTATIGQLKAQGKIVVCYFSAGSYEGWRPDWAQYFTFISGSSYDGTEPPFAGKMSGWDERWLDVRDIELLRPIMRGRIAMAVSKGCDAVEPDNVDAWSNGSETLVPISAQDQIAYNRMLAEEAHAQGMSIGLKNDVDQIPELVDYFDWALNEQCFQYNECGNYDIFVSKNKAVFGVEYSGDPAGFCPQAKASKLSWMKKQLSLEVWRQGCENY